MYGEYEIKVNINSEVKWSDKPNMADAKYIIKFMHEYPEALQGYIICRTPQRYQITEKIMALPWQEIQTLFS